VGDDQWRRLALFGQLLLERNEQVNLVSRATAHEFEARHLLDCATLLPTLERLGPANLVDIGSGGGLPGLIIAIARPQTQVTLVESIGKKCRFMEDAARDLVLQNVTVLQARVEDLASRSQFAEAFDCLTARGVGSLADLCELAGPLVGIGGALVAMKGGDPWPEILAAPGPAYRNGFGGAAVTDIVAPPLAPRTIVVYGKQRAAEPRTRKTPVTRRRRQQRGPQA
jgi:16S rRNA (guanine527-N7)-methyltransferase